MGELREVTQTEITIFRLKKTIKDLTITVNALAATLPRKSKTRAAVVMPTKQELMGNRQ